MAQGIRFALKVAEARHGQRLMQVGFNQHGVCLVTKKRAGFHLLFVLRSFKLMFIFNFLFVSFDLNKYAPLKEGNG